MATDTLIDLHPDTIYELIKRKYHQEYGRLTPLEITRERRATDDELCHWMGFLQEVFPGFESDGCTCAPSLTARAACQWHDLLYFLGVSRRLADFELLRWMQSIDCHGTYLSWMIHGAWARIYYYCVRPFGWIPYRSHRRRGNPPSIPAWIRVR